MPTITYVCFSESVIFFIMSLYAFWCYTYMNSWHIVSYAFLLSTWIHIVYMYIYFTVCLLTIFFFLANIFRHTSSVSEDIHIVSCTKFFKYGLKSKSILGILFHIFLIHRIIYVYKNKYRNLLCGVDGDDEWFRPLSVDGGSRALLVLASSAMGKSGGSVDRRREKPSVSCCFTPWSLSPISRRRIVTGELPHCYGGVARDLTNLFWKTNF